MAESDSKTIAKAATVNLLGTLAKSSRALVTIFVTRVSGPGTFGLFMLTVAVAELVSRFTIFGMDKSLLKFLPEARASDTDRSHAVLTTVLGTAAILSVTATVVIVVGSPWIAEAWLKEASVESPLRLVALAVLPLTMVTLLMAATKALKIMRYDAFVSGLLMPLAMLGLAVPILWTEDDVLTLILAYVGSTTIGLVAALRFFSKHFSIVRSLTSPARRTARSVLHFSTPLGLHDFVQYLAMKLELFLLAYFVGPIELGVYALASELSFVLKKLRQTLDPIMIPLLSEAGARGQRERLQALLQRVIRWLLLLGIPYVGVLALFTEPVLSLFGTEFVVGATALLLLCAAQLLNVGTGVIDMAMLASGRPRFNLINVLVLLGAQTALNLWLIPRYGIVGAAAAALGAFALLSAVRLTQALIVLEVNPFARSHLKPLFAAGLAAAAVWFVAPWTGGGSAISPVWLVPFLLIYAIGMKLLGVEEEDAALLRSAARKLGGRRAPTGHGPE